MKTINLIDINKEMCEQWALYFKDVPNVNIYCSDFFSVKADCIVSPANSFGYMDGGLDLVISEKLGWHIQEGMQHIIKENYNGELLVGQKIKIPTENKDFPWIICAPTMRLPMDIRGTVNSYLATKAVFRSFANDNRLQSINISGMGALSGKMPLRIVAKQMNAAYNEIFTAQEKPNNLRTLAEYHNWLIS